MSPTLDFLSPQTSVTLPALSDLSNPSNLLSIFTSAFTAANLLRLIAALFTLFLIPKIFNRIIWPYLHTYFSPLNALPGPKGGTWRLGFIDEMHQTPGGPLAWYKLKVQKHGHVFRYPIGGGNERLFTVDTRALNHVFTNSMIWEKPALMRRGFTRLLGDGLFSAEGLHHKKQRRAIAPSFSTGHIRELTKIFVSKSQHLRDVLLSKLPTENDLQDESKSNKVVKIDAYYYTTRTALEMIGLAGFNYSFNALNEDQETDELFQAYTACLHPVLRPSLNTVLQHEFPFLKKLSKLGILPKDAWLEAMDEAQKKLMGTAKSLMEKKKREIMMEKSNQDDHLGSKGKAKDLLTLLTKSNAAEMDPKQRLSDDEVASQIVTFLVAGHETVATSVAWTLYSLASTPAVQTRLREELKEFSCSSTSFLDEHHGMDLDSPTMDELNSLTYLDAVVREGLRLHCIIHGTPRVATQDDVIPLEKPFLDRHGQLRHNVPVKKGDSIYISMVLMNTLESIWGEDASEFNPDRWFDLPEGTASMPGIWGNQLTFTGGPHSCVGFALAVVEMKALLYTLIKNFEFELAVPKEQIIVREGIVARPGFKGDHGVLEDQLPMLIRRAS